MSTIIETRRRVFGTKKIIFLVLFIIVGMYGNYKRVEKLDDKLIKEISYWIPIVEDVMNSDKSISDNQRNDIIDKVNDTVQVNSRSRTELLYMGEFSSYITYVYLYKYHISKGNLEDANEANLNYKLSKQELKMLLHDHRDKYDYVNELWEIGVFVD